MILYLIENDEEDYYNLDEVSDEFTDPPNPFDSLVSEIDLKSARFSYWGGSFEFHSETIII